MKEYLIRLLGGFTKEEVEDLLNKEKDYNFLLEDDEGLIMIRTPQVSLTSYIYDEEDDTVERVN